MHDLVRMRAEQKEAIKLLREEYEARYKNETQHLQVRQPPACSCSACVCRVLWCVCVLCVCVFCVFDDGLQRLWLASAATPAPAPVGSSASPCVTRHVC